MEVHGKPNACLYMYSHGLFSSRNRLTTSNSSSFAHGTPSPSFPPPLLPKLAQPQLPP